MMRSAAGSALAGVDVAQSTTHAPNKAALGLQNKGRAASYLRPIKVAANLVLLIEMQFSGHAGDVARSRGSFRPQAGPQPIGVESEGVEAVAPRGASRPRCTHAVADLRGHR